jgi:PBSX family phage portal protein
MAKDIEQRKVVDLASRQSSEGGTSRISERRYKLQKIRDLFKQDDEGLHRRYVEETDPFVEIYESERILKPPFNFVNLYTIYEESDILQAVIEAMQLNVDGFGYRLDFLGDDATERETTDAQTQRIKAENFFDQVNETESFMTVRKKQREDLEVLGNSGFEVIRNRIGEVQLIYHLPFKYMRVSARKENPVPVEVTLMRNGKPTTIKIKKTFKRFVQISKYGTKLRYFKEFGDPRIMDYRSGDYVEQTRYKASEVWYFKTSFGGEIYGVPRWIGAVLQVMGRRSSQFVNYDLFKNQGIAPLLIMISGGVLNDESLDELYSILRSMRGEENFNRIALLESQVEGLGIEEKGSAKMELKNMTEYRKEDMMFDRYLNTAKDDVRHRYRLPDLYIGQSETYTHATATAARMVAEEQIFIPERTEFDENVNNTLVKRELKIDQWKYKSKGPQIVGSGEISEGVKMFSDIGAFSINNAIAMANKAFALEMSQFDASWANYPLPIVMKLLELGQLAGVEPLVTGEIAEKNSKQLPVPRQRLLPAMTEKFFKSDMFSPDEVSLYRFLTNFQSAIDTGALDRAVEKAGKTCQHDV